MTWFFYALTSAILASAAIIIAKKALLKERAMEYAATLSIVTGVFSIPLFFIGSYENLNFNFIIIIFFSTLLGSAGYVLVQKSTRHLEVSTISPLRAFSPVIIAVLAFIILGESLTRFQTAGIILILIGAYIIEAHKGDSFIKTISKIKKSKYINYFFIALFIYGLTSILDRYLLGIVGIDPITFIAFVHLFLAIDLLIMLTIFHDGIKGIKHGFKNIGWIIIVLGILTIGYRLTFLEAVALENIGLASPVKQLSILFSTILGGKVFHEKNLLKKTLATIIMLVGVILIIL
jgi:drug/metabolite transporter (DMT)-like permease